MALRHTENLLRLPTKELELLPSFSLMFYILVRSVGLAKKVERRRSNDAPQKSVVIFYCYTLHTTGGELVLFQGACVHAVFPGTARDLLSKSGKCGQAGPFGESAHGVTVRVPQGDDMCVAEAVP